MLQHQTYCACSRWIFWGTHWKCKLSRYCLKKFINQILIFFMHIRGYNVILFYKMITRWVEAWRFTLQFFWFWIDARSWIDCVVLVKSQQLTSASTLNMKTSSNGKFFRVTGPYWGKSTGRPRSQRPVTRNFDVLFDMWLNKRLSKQSRRRWFETSSRLIWRQCNGRSSAWTYSKHYHQFFYYILWQQKL